TRLFTGHIPFHEFNKLRKSAQLGIIQNEIVGERIIFIDRGMGEKFGDRGGYAIVGRNGLSIRGFESKESDEIVTNPSTTKIEKAKDGTEFTKILFTNPGVDQASFLSRMKLEMHRRLAVLAQQLGVVPGFVMALIATFTSGFTAGHALFLAIPI